MRDRPPRMVSAQMICALAVMLAACTAYAPHSLRPAGSCTVLAADNAPPRVRIAATGSITPGHAPVPSSQAEAIAFAQIYETLVRVDCTGAVASGVAASWSRSEGGEAWTFRLREDVRFSDGTPLDAATLAAAWAGAAYLPPLAGVVAAGRHEIRIVPVRPQPDVRWFAQPALSVTRLSDEHEWPAGTGTYRPAPTGNGLVLVNRRHDTVAPDTLVIATNAGSDARGALDSGIDALVSADPATIEYALMLERYDRIALPWTRTYVLVTPVPAVPPLEPTDEERAAVARDAAPFGTRAASDRSLRACGAMDAVRSDAGNVPAATFGQARASVRIAYERDDSGARAIAERIVALAWPAGRAPAWLRTRLPEPIEPPAVLALDAAALQRSVRSGEHAAHVVALSRCSFVPAGFHAAALHVTPLVDARDHLLVKDVVGTVTVDAHGRIRFGGDR